MSAARTRTQEVGSSPHELSVLNPVAQRHVAELCTVAAQGGQQRDRPGAVATVNDHLWQPGAVATSLYTGRGRQALLAALNQAMAEQGWVPLADHELHTAPQDGLPAPALPGEAAARPDPWTWTTTRAVSKTKCSGTVHRVVFDHGETLYPDHPEPAGDDSCRRSPHLTAVKNAYGALGPLRYFGPTWFADHGRSTVPLAWSQGLMPPHLSDNRFETKAHQFYGAGAGEGVDLPQDTVLVHDPMRPDLTGITGRREPGLPDNAWWDGPGLLHIQLCIGAWWPLEVDRQPWRRVDDLLALEVLRWDLDRNQPREMLLLDWCEDPCARLHPYNDRTGWIPEFGLPIVPVLVRCQVAQQRPGQWTVLDQVDRTVITGVDR